ncbi:MAG: hypothetical protein U0166_01685 [Acidobacteriota bacterium]
MNETAFTPMGLKTVATLSIALAEQALASAGRGREHPKARPLLALAKSADTAGR